MDKKEVRKAPAFQLYAKDALDAKVTRMSDAAQGVYWRLIFHVWAHTKTQYSIRDLDQKLAKILGLSNYKWKRYREEIQANGDPLFIEKDGMLISKRLMEEREKQVVRKKQTQEAARIRWEKERMQTHMRSDMQADMREACPSSSTPSSTADPKPKDLPPNGGCPTEGPDAIPPNKLKGLFEEIWKRFPPEGKVGKKEAKRHFMAKTTDTGVRTWTRWKQINKALDVYLGSKRVKSGHIQNGKTWFNNWTDWVDYTESLIEGKPEREPPYFYKDHFDHGTLVYVLVQKGAPKKAGNPFEQEQWSKTGIPYAKELDRV